MEEVVGSALVKIASDSVEETQKGIWGLLARAIGPTVDVYGNHWAERAEQRLANQKNILRKTAEKSERLGLLGPANVRVADRILTEGAAVDNELLAEYYSGLLAASRSQDGKDDRAVYWTNVVSGMSSIQIRLHYALYRNWVETLGEIEESRLGNFDLRRARAEVELTDLFYLIQTKKTYMSVTAEGTRRLMPHAHVTVSLQHAIGGLHRQGLIAEYVYGERASVGFPESQFVDLFSACPTLAGLELFGSVLGYDELAFHMLEDIEVPELSQPVRRLRTFVLPRLTRSEF